MKMPQKKITIHFCGIFNSVAEKLFIWWKFLESGGSEIKIS